MADQRVHTLDRDTARLILKLRVPLAVAEKLFEDTINKGLGYRQTRLLTNASVGQLYNDLIDWNKHNIALIEQVFSNTSVRDEYSMVLEDWPDGINTFQQAEREFAKRFGLRCRELQSIRGRLYLYALQQPNDTHSVSDKPRQYSNRVFIVHGHDEALKLDVELTLKQLGLEPIILHKQANQGKTIIEKFEAHADVGFAVVLLTPDDIGGNAGSSGVAELSPRARQNVVLELGYFVGKLGRERVVALRKGNTEIPSDLHGVVYENADEGGAWKHRLGKELKAAGYAVDLNKLV
jgi:predicted nucleotide-binding protein